MPGLTVFLCGDVMTGRGVDQILPRAGDPALREPAVTDARAYVELAERANGPIPRPVEHGWPWGEALAVLDEVAPEVRLINLETAITSDSSFAANKSVHYRMHPDNIGCLTVVRPDICVLANNHVLDFGPTGLADTMATLAHAGIPFVGAGADADTAERPVTSGRVVCVAAGMNSAGVPRNWAATSTRAGVAFVPELSNKRAEELAARASALKQPGDVAVASLHWGSNWGFHIDSSQRRFAHGLIDSGIDVVYGHSSHHPRPIEIYRNRLILYGCGDLINDYEGIGGYETFRDDLRLMYFVSIESGELTSLRMVPMRARRMRLEHASRDDTEWLHQALNDVSRDFGTQIDANGTLTVHRR
jgi:poly-gamma-glutamate capsule biosynthesis protein CapA/YwtB (metallophosphatase superfamily)